MSSGINLCDFELHQTLKIWFVGNSKNAIYC